MPTTVSLHKLEELSHEDSKHEILLDTNRKTELYIMSYSNKTIITLPYGNKFDIVDGRIIIFDKD